MTRRIVNRLIGLSLLAFCAVLWAWMLGWFAKPYPPGSLKDAPMFAAWLAPGLLSYPMMVSVVAGVAGLLYLTGVLPLRTDSDDDKPE